MIGLKQNHLFLFNLKKKTNFFYLFKLSYSIFRNETHCFLCCVILEDVIRSNAIVNVVWDLGVTDPLQKITRHVFCLFFFEKFLKGAETPFTTSPYNFF